MPSELYTRYFRIEAEELVDGLTRGLLDLEKEGGAGSIDQCFRLAHTLKGAAGAVRQRRIEEIGHAIEDVLAPYRRSGEPIPGAHVSELLRLVGMVRDELAAPGPPSSSSGAGGSGAGGSGAGGSGAGGAGGAGDEPRAGAIGPISDAARIAETARVEVAEVNELADDIDEALVQLGALEGGVEALVQAERLTRALIAIGGGALVQRAVGGALDERGRRARGLLDQLRVTLGRARGEIKTGLGRIQTELGRAQGRARELQLVPVSGAISALELAVREAAGSVGKSVDFVATGGEIRIDGYVLAAVREAMIHLARNAVDHGVEPEDERLRAGKPAAGQIRLAVERRGSRVAFLCSDDGRGIDLEAVRHAAVESGFGTPEEAARLTEEEALALVFQAGLSTSEVVGSLSGRGVGLDVVREMVEQLKGSVTARSEPGRGTTLEIVVPVSLSSLTALWLQDGELTALLPLDAVRGALRLADGTVLRGPERDAILYEERLIPFASLGAVLGSPHDRGSRSAVVIEAGPLRVALGVERLLGSTPVIIKPLPEAAGSPPAFAGATFDARGDPVLVLDPQGVLDAVRTAPPAARGGSTSASTARGASSTARPARASILIVDDSLTTRMLEQGILESEGYEVDLASSGEEGLEKAAGGRHGLFLVDVEMPGMSGFQFAERVRADPELRGTPLVIVSSLSSPADRRLATKAGADGYIVKGEFDQRVLLQTVAGLLARRARVTS